MILENYYYYFKSALSTKFCEDILNFSKQFEPKVGQTFGNPNIENNTTKNRKSNVIFIDEKWIYKEIHPFIHEANIRSGWNFQWDFSESCQFTKYGVGQYYGWHCDSYKEPYHNNPNTNLNGKIRKLSVTVSLSEPEDYDGGDLEFDFRDTVIKKRVSSRLHTCDEIKPRGSIVIFPSFVWHRVTPVTRGTRYSFVVWNLGYPFK